MTALLSNLTPAAVDLAGVLAQIDGLRAQLAVIEASVLAGIAKPGVNLFPRAWVDRLAEIVAFEFGMETNELVGSLRNAKFIRARFTWVWLVRTISDKSFPETARLTGYGDHTAVMHACRRVAGWRAANPDYQAVTDQLLRIGQALRAPPAAPAEEAAE